MIPGEYRISAGDIELVPTRKRINIDIKHTGDRPVQVGSHMHFYEVNRALQFDRLKAWGMRLDIPAGTAVRFEPGEEKLITLVELGGKRILHGGNGLAEGPIDDASTYTARDRRLADWLALGDSKEENDHE